MNLDNDESLHASYRKDKSIVSHFSDGPTTTFTSGETIINGYDEPTGVYLIKQGFVKAYSTSHDGHANLLLIHKTGDIIPLPWSLDGTHATGLFYEAMNNVIIIKTSKEKLRTTMGNNSWLTQEILNQTVEVIAVYTRRIQILEYRTARGRVIAELLLLAERFGKEHNKIITVKAPITHQDIADSINTSRETTSRVLETLFEEKLLSQENRQFVIPDIEKLHESLK